MTNQILSPRASPGCGSPVSWGTSTRTQACCSCGSDAARPRKEAGQHAPDPGNNGHNFECLLVFVFVYVWMHRASDGTVLIGCHLVNQQGSLSLDRGLDNLPRALEIMENNLGVSKCLHECMNGCITQQMELF